MTDSRGGSFLRFRTGTTGGSGRHVAYITHERAVVDREEAMLLYQLPEHVRGAADYKELRQTLIAYADTREEIEAAQHMARGKPRISRFRTIRNAYARGDPRGVQFQR